MQARHLGLALSLIVSTVGLAGCSVSVGGSDKIDQAKAEKFLKVNIHPTPTSVSCPSGVKIVSGGTFSCSITLPSGTTGTVTIHMTNAKGHIEVSNKDLHLNG